ncbi:hypothetical protein LCI18_007787 [Fusarium solani-melongenae]|uniref:Uncharacterized protein n=1 Tax=Fusarium solani subsp. cucurbitae TaxID=2747967 RepID=A0ACD3Z6T3_FUSSC|nr:hypothetical protein LCI18_007787 [Fusarium solani-melongenae]
MPRKGGKSTQRGKPRLLSTEFGQLETTPTSRHPQSQGQDNSNQTARVKSSTTNQKQQSSFVDDFDDGVDDVDLISLAPFEEPKTQPAPANDFSWSETGSLTRRSSPLRGGEASKDIWQFDNQGSLIDPFSSPKSGKGDLPKTQPLTQSLNTHLVESPNKAVVVADFSETASTGQRSSPFPSQIAAEESWELLRNKPLLSSTIPDSLQLPEMPPYTPKKPIEHLPADELYDATPPRSSARRPVAPPPQRSQAHRESVKHDQDPAPSQTKKTKPAPTPHPKALKNSLAQYIEDTDFMRDEEVSVSSHDHPKPRETHRKGNKTSPVQEKGPSEDNQATPQAQDDPAAGQAQKKKKRKQRAKTPIQFDKVTQAMIDPQPKKNTDPPVRVTLVNAMKQAMLASSSPALSARKKAAPKTTRKAAPKSTPKPAPKPVTRKVQPRKKRKMSVDDEYEDNSIIINTSDFAEPKSVINTRARTAAHSKTKATRGKQGPEINTGSQGLFHDPIVVASDPASSSISEDEFKQTEPPRPSQGIQTVAQNSMAGTNATPMATSNIFLEHGIDQQVAVLPQEPPSSVAPQPSSAPKAKEAIVDTTSMNAAASTELAEEPTNPRKRSRETNAKPPQALSHRDPNIPVKGALRTTRGAGISKKDTSTRVNKAGFVQRRKSSKMSRSFSISKAGSPVPVETGQGLLIDESSPIEAQSLVAAEPNHDKTGIELKARPRNEQREQGSDLLPGLTALNKNLQNQIFESLQGQDEASVVADGGKRAKTTEKSNEVAEQTVPEKPTDEVAGKLHGLVETLLSHLATKEATIYRGADAHRKSGIDCVDKMERMYSQERNALADACKKDGDRFARRVREARETVEDGEKARGKAMHQLEQAAIKQRQLYQQASTGLRALHGRLLKRKMVEDEGI